MFQSVEELVHLAESQNIKISEVMIRQEMEYRKLSRQEVLDIMEKNLLVMEEAVEKGLKGVTSASGLTGGDAVNVQKYMNQQERNFSGFSILSAIAKAMATNEVNAAMGKICATPTAGASGVIPGVLFSAVEKIKPTRKEMIEFLFTSGAFGFVIANNASISGAAGGCQAEVGSSSGMAAAALTELAGGSPQQASEAMAMTLKNMLGLVCDPVAGLVEVPCIKRNAMGAANAMVFCDMALAGVTSRIPSDEVIEAMFKIGQEMPNSLKETAEGGLAATATAHKFASYIHNRNPDDR